MKRLKVNYITLIFNFFIFIFISKSIYSNESIFEIKGNNYTDYDVIISLLGEIPKNLNEEYSNEILNTLNDSELFSEVSVEFDNNKYLIKVKEFPTINKLSFINNERLNDDELELIASAINLEIFNDSSIDLYVNEIKKAYISFGYNNIDIQYSEIFNNDNNTVDLYFQIDEGSITKINKIFVNGNESVLDQEILEIISSKTKTFKNIFANNNYKPSKIKKDEYLIINYYRNNGFVDINIETQIEYLKSNKVNIYFNINEGNIYLLSSIKILDDNNLLDSNTLDLINYEIDKLLQNINYFSGEAINELRSTISSIIINSGNEFFEIKVLDRVENNEVEIIFQILSVSPRYTKQINIIGNSRTFDYVIRRELEIVEGDAIYDSQIKNIQQKLSSLNLFESVIVKEERIDNSNVNLIIEIIEKQTGTFNAGVSVGTLDGFAIVTGLRESNFYGTGRSLDLLLNTSEDKNQFKLATTDRLSYENDADISYNLNYKQEDFSTSSSYKLDTFTSGIGIGYKINKNVNHNIDFEYVIKDYQITNTSTASDSIKNSSGGNVSFLFKNNLRFSTINPGFISRNGTYINFNNTLETPTSSNNGFIRNILTMKQYYSFNRSIYSFQTRLGNIFSLNNNDILTDDKFSLGGRWLRGFDNFGAGPRNSITSYVGGNNVIVTKLDYSYELTKSSDFPVYLNLFNDYGLIWENKTKPSQSDNNIRSSVGFGIKYYSPIGPIGFSWGFPIMEEEYDINRMFLFSIGNID